MGKKKYVTDDYVKEVEHYIYNDLPLLSLINVPEDVVSYDYEKFEKQLIKGEKYVQLEHELEYVAITSKGRVWNLRYPREFITRFSPNTQHVYVASIRLKMEDIFETQGWDYNCKKILKNFRKNDWVHRGPYVKVSKK